MTRYFSLILTAAVMMITAASPHSIELTHIHLAYIYVVVLSLFIAIMKKYLKVLDDLLLLLTVALAETIPLLSVSISSLSSIVVVLPPPTSLLMIRM